MRSPRRRSGVSLLELVIGLAILVVGVIPYLDLMRGARGILGDSQEMLLLQSQTLQALEEARSLVSSGGLADLGEKEEELLEAEESGVRYAIVIHRVEGRPHYRIEVRAEGFDRFFRLASLVADPLAGFSQRDDSPLPDPDDFDHESEHLP